MARVTVIVALIVLAALCAPIGPGPATGVTAAQSDQPEFSSVHFTITVHENGSAEWTFRYRTPLENESQYEHFRSFAREFENESLPLYEEFQSRASTLVSDGENVTDRSMTAGNFSRDAYVRGLDDDLGVVEMSFTWTNFARVDGDRVLVGDLFEGGLYVGEDQRLVVKAGPGLHFTDVGPGPDAVSGETLSSSDTVTWFGPYEFTDERPRVVLSSGPVTTSDGTSTGQSGTDGTTDGASDPPSGQSGGPPLAILATLLFAGVLAAAGLWWRRSHDDESAATTPGDSSDAEPAPAVSDAEMVSDEQRVLDLLEDHGGRMRQVQVVEQTDWSKSKVSMLLSDMEEEGRISRIRLGRENVVSLPEHEPDPTPDDGAPDE